jgi:hypothetical protein
MGKISEVFEACAYHYMSLIFWSRACEFKMPLIHWPE